MIFKKIEERKVRTRKYNALIIYKWFELLISTIFKYSVYDPNDECLFTPPYAFNKRFCDLICYLL